jgi:hypothetical protein
VEVAARLAVLVACGVAGGTLFVLLASPARARPPGGPSAGRPDDQPPESPVPAPLGGLAPASLAAFVLLAGGTVLTGAATVDAGDPSAVLAVAGIGMLAIAGIPAGRAALRILRAPGAAGALVAPSSTLIVLAWAGAALALGSWLLAVGAVVMALLASVRIERRPA